MRAVITITIAALLGGCAIAEQLEGEPCAVEEDCFGTQHCARTPEEDALALDGLCLPKKRDCEKGQQLGCACDPADFDADCSSFFAPTREGYPDMMCDATLLVCVAIPTETATETATETDTTTAGTEESTT